MTAGLAEELIWADLFLRTAVPRILKARDPRPPVLVFTDAALEGDGDEIATYGGVIINGDEVVKFGARLSQARLAVLQKDTTRVIAVLEVLPAAAVAIQWKKQFAHRRVFYFIDNDAARARLIKQHSDSEVIRNVLKAMAHEQLRYPNLQRLGIQSPHLSHWRGLIV